MAEAPPMADAPMGDAPPQWQRGANPADTPLEYTAGDDMMVGLNWDFGTAEVDVDVSAVTIDGNANVLEAVYYNQLQAHQGALKHSGDKESGDKKGYEEMIYMDLDILCNSPTEFVVFVVSCYKGGNFSNLKNANLDVLKHNFEQYHSAPIQLDTVGNSTLFVPGFIYRVGNGWFYHPVFNCTDRKARNFQDALITVKSALLPYMNPCVNIYDTLQVGKVFNMKKGDVVALPPGALTFKVGLGWSANGNVDLDAGCVMLDTNDNVVAIVNYQKLQGPGVTHSGDNTTGAGEGDDELVTVKLHQIPFQCTQVIFVVNMYTQGKSFSRDIFDAYVRLMCGNPLSVVAHFGISADEGGSLDGQCLLFCRLYKTQSGWKYEAIGHASQGRAATTPETLNSCKALNEPPVISEHWQADQSSVMQDNGVNWDAMRLPPIAIQKGANNNAGSSNSGGQQSSDGGCCTVQ